jgi:hypothetical protein
MPSLILCLIDRKVPLLIEHRRTCPVTGLYVDFGYGYYHLVNHGKETLDVELYKPGDPIRLRPGEEFGDITCFVSPMSIRARIDAQRGTGGPS